MTTLIRWPPRIRRRGKWARVAALSVLVLITLATLGPVNLRPELTSNADLDRVLGFVVAGLCLGIAFPRWRWVSAAALVVFAGVLELGQLLTSDRDASGVDWLVKCGGALLGVAAVRVAELNGGIQVNGEGKRYARGRTVALTGLIAVGFGMATWWTRSPPAAVQAALAAMPAGERPSSDFVIDIWDQDLQSFHASVRHRESHRKFLVMSFARAGARWRLISLARRS